MRIGFLLLALSLATFGCRRTVTVTSSTTVTTPDTLVAGTVIRSAGTWSAHTSKGSKRLDIKIDADTVSWVVSNEDKRPTGGIGGSAIGEASSSMSLSSARDPWFVFVESPRRLWFFNGSDRLSFRLAGSGGIRGGMAVLLGKLVPTAEKIPEEIIPLLPADLQKLFPPIEPKTERPSL
jgi:hypothetical protein